MKHELRVMRSQGTGAIVNCSSLGGLVGLLQRAAYHGTKHAVLGMTKSAGVEYAPRGIRINAVCPGTIDTPMVADMLQGQADAMAEIMKQQSIGRLGRAEEVAAAVLWLCSPAASFVIGVGLAVDRASFGDQLHDHPPGRRASHQCPPRGEAHRSNAARPFAFGSRHSGLARRGLHGRAAMPPTLGECHIDRRTPEQAHSGHHTPGTGP
jgi:hypothetical protein